MICSLSMLSVYPWDDGEFGKSIQRWTMLPGSLHFNHVPKLIFDFIVLIILNRQKSIFCIEQRYATNDDYPGGSNRSVIKDIAQLGRVPFDNPTHDFCSYIRNYSDILKNGVLCGFYWFTLAVVFLAGTNIADLLALGYLIGAFIFLWQGSDFYLRPINTIISRWKWLLAFNVSNILIKTSFQMAGCLFMTQLTQNCCWLVHMLGITCTSGVSKEHLMAAEDTDLAVDSTGCPKITHHVVLLWDAICFAFIIFQLRIFKSHYFCHIITDTKANNILASRWVQCLNEPGRNLYIYFYLLGVLISLRACDRNRLPIVMIMRSRCCTRSNAKWNAYAPHSKRCCVRWTSKPISTVSQWESTDSALQPMGGSFRVVLNFCTRLQTFRRKKRFA